MVGRSWALANLLYGMIRHLLPFLSAIYVAGFVIGISLSSWLARNLRGERGAPCNGSGCVHRSDLLPFLWIGLALVALSGVFVWWRNRGRRHSYSNQALSGLRSVSLFVAALAIAVLALLVVFPLALFWLHDGGLAGISAFAAGGLTAVAGSLSAVLAWISKNRASRVFRILVPVVIALSAPIFVIVPLLGFTYWNAQAGGTWSDDPWRWGLAVSSVAYLGAAFRWIDEVTSVPHLFYRERLASAFVGYRDKGSIQLEQPPYEKPILFSAITEGTSAARLPNLVVCSAVNLAGDLPAGRLAASFTFERHRVGGPMTGYVSTKWLQQRAGPGVVTLPALMAVSGAAVAPSMGKMTRPALRFLMAVFDLRLGVWIPNPYRSTMRRTATEVRSRRSLDPDAEELRKDTDTWRSPGALYIFREAFGQNRLKHHYVYVTDGGHWENLGLVELLRRGCGDIVCIDGSGGDAKSFGTLSEAIALARADLGVDIAIDLSDMRSGEDGKSARGFAIGSITFPDADRTKGTLVYIRAVLTAGAPEDIASYAAKDAKFPNHPTTDQLFDDERFEAYRELGRYLTAQAIRSKSPPPARVEGLP